MQEISGGKKKKKKKKKKKNAGYMRKIDNTKNNNKYINE